MTLAPMRLVEPYVFLLQASRAVKSAEGCKVHMDHYQRPKNIGTLYMLILRATLSMKSSHPPISSFVLHPFHPHQISF